MFPPSPLAVPSEKGPNPQPLASGLWGWCTGVLERLQGALPIRPSTAILFLILAVEGILQVFNAKLKPFWYDELFTLHLGSIRPLAAMIEAFRGGVDVMTVVFMTIMASVLALPGDPHVTLRLPSILGYLLALAGAFLFVRKRYGGLAALAAVLLLVNSPFRLYGIEARPSALLTGLLAISAACWQRIGTSRITSPLLWLSFGLAVTMHYYAALALAVLACAEAAWWIDTRKARLQVWLLLAASAALIAVSLPFVNAARSTLLGTSSKGPPLETLLITYQHYFRLDTNLWMAVLLLATILFGTLLRRLTAQAQPGTEREGFQLPEVTLAYSLVLYPAVLVAITMALRLQYFPRYGWPAILGLVFMASMLLDGIRNRCIAVAIAAAMALSFSAQAAKDTVEAFGGAWAHGQASPYVTPGLKNMAGKFPNHKIVVADMFAYVEMSYYGGHGLNPRTILLTRTRPAGRSKATVTAGGAVGQLARFAPLRLEDCDLFLERNPEFLLYSNRQTYEWIPRYLLGRGHQLRMLAEDGSRATIYLVSKPLAEGSDTRRNAGAVRGEITGR